MKMKHNLVNRSQCLHFLSKEEGVSVILYKLRKFLFVIQESLKQ